jgi:methylthioribose-1-phosphate isomerase
MAAMLMQQGKVQKIFVGSDRIAKNGDAANKIGTYSVAVLAKHHKIPFYVVAPYTTVDEQCPTGAEIPIEERNAEEVRRDFSPREVAVFNPAFDVTPREIITKLVLDRGLT